MSENDQVKSMENLMFGKQQQKNNGKPCRACVDFKTWKRKMTSGNGATKSKDEVFLTLCLVFENNLGIVATNLTALISFYSP